MTLTPLLMCAYRSRYLAAVLGWLKKERIEEKYRILIWDNGETKDICAAHGLTSYSSQSGGTSKPKNVGKALGMVYLVDIANKALPDATCYVCMDDDVIVDREHLDALVAAAHRPSIGMVAARFHPFNTVMPAGGSVIDFDPCPVCSTAEQRVACSYCRATGKDPQGLRLRTYPAEDRTKTDLGKVAGTLFAVSKAAVATLEWAPYLYPVLIREHNKPVIYWGEDAALDIALTTRGFTNGYLEMASLSPAVHLPELNQAYMNWKLKARWQPPIDEFDFGAKGTE